MVVGTRTVLENLLRSCNKKRRGKMGLFLCDLCNQQLSLKEVKHVCKPEDIKAYIDRLDDDRRVAERKLDDIREAIFQVMSEIPSFEEEKVTVSTKWLKRLWEARS